MIDDQYLDTIADSEDQRPAIPPSPNLTPDRMRRDPGVRLAAVRHCDASPLRCATGKTLSGIGFPTFDG